MPPHKHHGHHGGRRFGRGRSVSIYEIGQPYEEVYYDCPRDLDGFCLPPIPIAQAGDIFPTFVTATDAQNYLNEVNTAYTAMNLAVTTSNVADDFKQSWAIQWQGWIQFSTDARASVSFWNAKAVMQQTDRWQAQLKNWSTQFQSIGGKPPAPPIGPGQGIPDPPGGGTVNDLTKLAIAIGVTAGIILVAPKVLSFIK